MRKRVLIAVSAATALAGLSASNAMAAPPDPADDPFVCPVLKVSDQAFEQSGQFAGPIGDGEYTILPGKAGSAETFNGNVPTDATNADGAGSPGGSHSSPGDADYSAVWSGNASS
jgi:hypothetical protein